MKRQLGNMEHALTLTGQFEPFSVVGVLRLQNGPTPEMVRHALDQLQREQPLLNVTITARGKRLFFEEFAESPPIPLQIESWQDEAQWQTVATDALNTAIDIQTAPLMRSVYLYQTGENKLVDLVFIYHHAIMDAASGVQFYHRLLSICAGETGGGDVQSLRPAADEMLPPAMRGLKRNGRNLQYMAAQMADEIRYRWQLGDGRVAPLHITTARNLIVTRQLDKASTKVIIRRSRRERVSMNSVVSTALLLAVHKHLYEERPLPLRALTSANLRPYLTPPIPNEYFGCCIAMLRYTLFCDKNSSFWQAVQLFQTALSQSSKRGEKFTAMLMSKQLMKMITRFQAFRMGTTAVSYSGPLNLQPSYGNIQVKDIHGFISNNRLGPEFTAFAKILFGKLSWDFLYLDADMNHEMAKTIANEVIHILETNG
ncbi:MAG: hypothetical protein GY805_20635 [Chloroflexi bacterium]|nr:hypothetical protein [Chloroflexota bacterium]